MLRRILFICSLLATVSLAAQKPYYAPVKEVFAQDSLLTNGNFLLYPSDKIQAPTPAPKGFKPCYVSTYTRHGSRYVVSASTYNNVYQFFTKAKEAGVLTEKGKEFADKYLEFYPQTINRNGDLTQVGWEQHTGIAKRMYRNYPDIFKGNAWVDARSTLVIRVIKSMYSELMQLKTDNPRLRITSDASAADLAFMDPMLENNPLMTARDQDMWSSKRSAWGQDYRDLMQEVLHPEQFFGRYITDYSFVTSFAKPEALEFTIWKVAADALCVGEEYSFLEYFTLDEMAACWEIENFRFYGVSGRNKYANGRNWAVHVTLLEDFLNKAREDVFGGECRARLRFGHDMNLCALMSLLRIPGFDEIATDKNDAKNVFRFYRSPMAANFQLIFFKNKKGDVLVKPMLNEEEVSLPIPGTTGPFYTWEAFEAYCNDIIADAYKVLAPKVAVTAHRGYWTGNAQNSIESLAKAQEFGFWGSEFDVHLTSDGVAVVNHDDSIGGIAIHDNTYEALSEVRLANGEKVPTLDEYLAQGEKSAKTVLVLEIKVQSSAERTIELTDKCIAALKAHGLYKPSRVIFISFSYDACKHLAKVAPEFTNQYLTGKKSPAEVHKDGINGIDYHYSWFEKNPGWVKEAHDLGMSVNVWTVNDAERIKAMIELGVDCITTNAPELVRSLLGGKEDIIN